MKQIELDTGAFAFVDDEDFDYLDRFSWREQRAPHTSYAMTAISSGDKDCGLGMHTMITLCPTGLLVDHLNHNGLDNQRHNLRCTSSRQNSFNRAAIRDSVFPGVHRQGDKWNATVHLEGETRYLGQFVVEIDAWTAVKRCLEYRFSKHDNCPCCGRKG
jgi:hypothetical protein